MVEISSVGKIGMTFEADRFVGGEMGRDPDGAGGARGGPIAPMAPTGQMASFGLALPMYKRLLGDLNVVGMNMGMACNPTHAQQWGRRYDGRAPRQRPAHNHFATDAPLQ